MHSYSFNHNNNNNKTHTVLSPTFALGESGLEVGHGRISVILV